ncbi:hypothetical protein CM49_04428 [Paenibacillus sp. P1XP2]|nr:hypothetical protein CM49_04428 [Paenibacillus sp. P1XP2]
MNIAPMMFRDNLFFFYISNSSFHNPRLLEYNRLNYASEPLALKGEEDHAA